MVVTRKIEIFICDNDKDLRKSYYEKLYANRDAAVKVANMAMSHLFALDNTMPYLVDEDKEKIEFLGCKGTKATKQNAPYVVASKAFKNKGIYMGMIPSVLQEVQKAYANDRKRGMWNRSLRSYKSTMPIPIKASLYYNLRFAEYEGGDGMKRQGCFFEVMGIPFQMKFGRDRSGNQLIVERIVKGEYKMCTSSIQIDGNKCFLLLCVDIPKKEVKIDADKILFAYLGVFNPIICTCDVRAAKEYDSGYKCFEIGTKEEFNYRRRQIQELARRCQINNRYTTGGNGRNRKCQAIDRFHDKERNYVDTKLHTYSRMLVDLAVKHGCGQIVLMNQNHREDTAKVDYKHGEPFVLRNWTYYGLKEKIAYKCKMVGITLKVEK